MGRWYEDEDGQWAYDEHGVEVRESTLRALYGDEPTGPPPGDVGDWIDPNAPDPTPPEVRDPTHPDYVEPWRPS